MADAKRGDEYVLALLTKQENYRLAKAKRETEERKNLEAAGMLVLRSEMDGRHRAAAVEVRKGVEAVIREISHVCPPDCRDAVLGALGSELDRLRARIGVALKVKDDKPKTTPRKRRKAR